MKILFSNINFCGKPENYGIIDEHVSRSAQPQKEDLLWLKEQGVTDIFNFRTMKAAAIDFDEKEEVEKLGMRYHNIPSKTKKPKEENIKRFMTEIDEVISKNGKPHLHCKAGADRTGMYAFIYAMKKGIKSLPANLAEWYYYGLHYKRYPDLIKWTLKYVSK